MRTPHPAVLAVLLLALPLTDADAQRAVLIEARNLAYDANYRNDQSGLRAAIATLQTLADVPPDRAFANYYLSWTYWALSASQLQAGDTAGALAAAQRAASHARSGLADRSADPELHTALANALIVIGVLDRSQLSIIGPELRNSRRRALELGRDNPRVVLMDAGILFNLPAEAGGGQELGLARWERALTLFEAEAEADTISPLAPRWGYAPAHGWLANLYLSLTPPWMDLARLAAERALSMRPDFWFVRERVLPGLR